MFFRYLKNKRMITRIPRCFGKPTTYPKGLIFKYHRSERFEVGIKQYETKFYEVYLLFNGYFIVNKDTHKCVGLPMFTIF